MKGSLSPVSVLGVLACTVESKTSKAGKQYATFELKVNQWRRTSEGVSEEVQIVLPVIAYGKIAETLGSYTQRGDAIFLTCSVNSREIESNGRSYRNLSLAVESLVLLPNTRPAVKTGGLGAPSQPIREARERMKQAKAPALTTYDENGDPSDIPF